MNNITSCFNLKNIIKRMKNMELVINIPLLIALYITLLFVSKYFNIFSMQPYTISSNEFAKSAAVVLISVSGVLLYAFIYYLLTPKSLNFKNAISIVLIVNMMRVILAYVFIPIAVFFVNATDRILPYLLVNKALDLFIIIADIYLILQVKKEYCKMPCKRINVLLTLRIIPVICLFI